MLNVLLVMTGSGCPIYGLRREEKAKEKGHKYEIVCFLVLVQHRLNGQACDVRGQRNKKTGTVCVCLHHTKCKLHF